MVSNSVNSDCSSRLGQQMPDSTVTPPAYNVQVFEYVTPGRVALRIGAPAGAHLSTLANDEHAQEGPARCSFALARSR